MAPPSVDDLQLPAQHLAEHEADPAANQRGYIKGTDYSRPYHSQWSRLLPAAEDECNTIFRHINCGYLSTYGTPPTLLALKQHAQALCNLILALVPTMNVGEIDAANARKPSSPSSSSRTTTASVPDPPAFKHLLNDAFDFLADLRTPYTNSDPDHQLPLRSLANEVRDKTDAHGPAYHCALATSDLPPRAAGEPARPYANHHNLLLHANACLERLDHELGPDGGLLALLPGDGDDPAETADREAAANSLLGQWLAFTQHLVRRAHELEIAYGNALDVVAGEAAAPLQVLSGAGADGRAAGRIVGFPQDRWVLANAGEDVWGHVHGALDRAEAVAAEMERVHREQGVSGQRMWEESERGRDAARGIVAVNFVTRYYRLAGQGHGTVFVLPAWERHPATEYTRLLEKKPGVVGVPMPKWPERLSEIERRERERKEKERNLAASAKKAQQGLDVVQDWQSIQGELERLQAEAKELETYLGNGSREFAKDLAKMKEREERTERAMQAERERHERQLEDVRNESRQLAKDVAELRMKLGREHRDRSRLGL